MCSHIALAPSSHILTLGSIFSSLLLGTTYLWNLIWVAIKNKIKCTSRKCCFIFWNGVVVQSFSRGWFFETAWTAAHQASLSFTISQSLLKLMSIKSVMPSYCLILCCPLPLPSVFPSHQGLFQWVSSLHQVAKVLEFQLQHQSFQWIFTTDFL